MQQTITFNDLISFAFNETAMGDTVKVTRTLESNPEAKECYDHILSTVHGVEKMIFSPSEEVSKRILQLAK